MAYRPRLWQYQVKAEPPPQTAIPGTGIFVNGVDGNLVRNDWRIFQDTATPPLGIQPGPGYESQWHFPYTDPQVNFGAKVRAAAGIAMMASGLFFAPTNLPTNIVTYAAAEIGGPIFSRSIDYQDLAFVPVVSTTSEDQWHQPWSTPVLRKSFQGSLQEGISEIFNVEIVTIDKWVSQQPDFARPKVSLGAPSQQVLASVPFVEDTTYESKWHIPWSEPVRTKPSFKVGTEPYQAHVPFNEDFGIVTKWHQPLSIPVRVKPRATEFPAYIALDHFFEVISPDKWWPQYPDFARQNRLATAQQQTLAAVPFVEDTTFESKWHQPWSEPTRLKKEAISRAYEQQTLAHVPFNEDFGIESKWHYSWSEPVRLKPSFRVGTEQYQAHVPFNEDFGIVTKWFEPWSDPVRVKLRVIENPALFWDSFFETITTDKWFAQWREPVRLKPGLPAVEQQTLAFDPQPFVSFSWYGNLSDPVRLKPGLSAIEQQFLALDQFSFAKIDWFNWLSEPKRFLAGLSASEQQAFTAGFVPIIPSVTNWYRALEEPVRLRRFATHLQSTTTFTPLTTIANVVRFSRGYIIC